MLDVVSTTIGSKETELVADLAAGCVTELEVEEERRAQPALTRRRGQGRSRRWPSAPSSTSACPQDIEWAVDGAQRRTADGRPAAEPPGDGVESPPARERPSSLKPTFGMQSLVSTLISPLAARRSDR